MEERLHHFEINPPLPSDIEKSAAMEQVKSEIELHYEEQVRGIMVRSKARWVEQGEKNSKQ